VQIRVKLQTNGATIFHAAAQFLSSLAQVPSKEKDPYVWVKTPGPLSAHEHAQVHITERTPTLSGVLSSGATHCGLTMQASFQEFSRLLEAERRGLRSSQEEKVDGGADVHGQSWICPRVRMPVWTPCKLEYHGATAETSRTDDLFQDLL
jgi:hypothetical protein